MSKQSDGKGQGGSKGGGKKNDGKRRVVIQLPTGSPLDAMSQDEIDKHVHDLIGKAGISNHHVGGPVDELLIEIGGSASPADSSPSAALIPDDGWAARWSRFCRN
jgi:hypothetical protein